MTKLQETQKRNWRVFRLRGLWGTYGLLDDDLALDAQAIVDTQLERMGAEAETARNRRRKAEFEAKFGEGV